jgi:chromatin remodeling complex protein RSC6
MSAKPATAKKASTTAAKKAAAPKKETKTKKTESKVAEPDPAVPAEKKERKRREVNKETVDLNFSDIQARVEAEIAKLRESTEKVRGIKFLRSINKAIKILHSDTKRVMKLKKKNNRKKTVVSGFLKPIKISPELATFTGWDINQTYSRVNVTKFICDYIKTNHLYNDEDKRLILCDDKLKTLLKYDPANPPNDKDGNPAPLNYFRLQRWLKPHFIKIDTTVPSTENPESKQEEKKPAKKATAKKAAPVKKAAPPAKKVEVEDEDDVEDEDLDD